MDIEDEWNSFLNNEDDYIIENNNLNNDENIIPKCSDLYISTTTKIAFLNQNVNLNEIFWKLPLLHYYDEKEGILKKQMKFNLVSQEEVNIVEEKISKIKNYVENYVIKKVSDNSITQFKDIRKISVGLCKKDLITFRSKKKSAFYNCFVLIIRYFYNNEYKEMHVKVFNTGKLEIPGIQNNEMFISLLKIVKDLLQPYFEEELDYLHDKSHTVLVNSNFNCGFLINREKLFTLLKYKYKIHATYDPCSYPGIQCKYKIEEYDEKKKDNISISFMIFRTGSVLIVGKCKEESLYNVFNYLKNILQEEYNEIKHNCQKIDNVVKIKKNKIRKKVIKVLK
tara:strand:+ start:587 stop:1600 length:1014 start_codon:yes stop_codon:yes gene_type:complete